VLTQASKPRHQHFVLPDAFLPSFHVNATKEAPAAYALAAPGIDATFDATLAGFVAGVDHFLVCEVLHEVLALGDAETPAADLLAICLNHPMLIAEWPAAVLAEALRRLLAVEKAALDFANCTGLCSHQKFPG
jgi:hypothetical protein